MRQNQKSPCRRSFNNKLKRNKTISCPRKPLKTSSLKLSQEIKTITINRFKECKCVKWKLMIKERKVCTNMKKLILCKLGRESKLLKYLISWKKKHNGVNFIESMDYCCYFLEGTGLLFPCIMLSARQWVLLWVLLIKSMHSKMSRSMSLENSEFHLSVTYRMKCPGNLSHRLQMLLSTLVRLH